MNQVDLPAANQRIQTLNLEEMELVSGGLLDNSSYDWQYTANVFVATGGAIALIGYATLQPEIVSFGGGVAGIGGLIFLMDSIM